MKSALPAITATLAAALSITGCGGSTPTHHQPPQTTAALVHGCPPGHSFMGCSSTPSPTSALPTFSTSGCKIPDVSSYQGHPNWGEAKSHTCGGIFKGGEYGVDPDAQYNADSLASLHIWHAMYWFVRNTGCSSEAAQIVNEAHATHVTVVINDLEVPEASGYAGCLVPAEKAAHLIPVDYTAPGTWPGGAGKGNAPLWQAEYGPTLHPFWNPVVAWQCTDGQFGCVTPIPGIGNGDVSVDLGITKLGSPPAPSNPHCFGSKPDTGNATCKKVRAEVAKWTQELHLSLHNLIARKCVLVWVRKSDDTVRVALKTGPLSSRIQANAKTEERNIASAEKKYA